MKKFAAVIFVFMFAQNACGLTINFSSTGTKTWPYNTVLSGANAMNVPNIPTGFHGIISGNLSGYGSLTKFGGGELILSGRNTYTGGTFVDGGTLLIESVNSLPSGSSLTVGANASVIFSQSVSGLIILSDLELSGPQKSASVVPEPSTIVLIISGLISAGLFFYRR